MLANLGLLYILARRLTQSAEAAALAAIIASYHHRWSAFTPPLLS